MEAWSVALVSGGLTLLASLLATGLAGRNAARNLRTQLEFDTARQRAQSETEEARRTGDREEERRARLFEHQREAATRFLEAFHTFSVSAAGILGASYARTRSGEDRTWEASRALEEQFGHGAAGRSLTAAMSSVLVLFPEAAANFAKDAVARERGWVAAMLEHYERGKPDPGPHPAREIEESLEGFRRAVRKIVGVTSSEQG